LLLGSILRRWVLTLIVELYPPPPLGSTLHRWVLSFVVGFYPLSLGSTLRRVLPFVVGLYPPLGPTLRRWALPSVGFYPSSLGSTLRWALPFVVEFYPLPFVAGPCRCGIFYASMVVLSSFTPPGCWVVDTLWLFVSCFIMPVFSALAIVVDSPSLGSIRVAVVGLD